MTAVAVWPIKPNADALLRRRLEDGWQPTATRLQSGNEILGHADCLVPLPSIPPPCKTVA